jgi:hypothetical protein
LPSSVGRHFSSVRALGGAVENVAHMMSGVPVVLSTGTVKLTMTVALVELLLLASEEANV